MRWLESHPTTEHYDQRQKKIKLPLVFPHFSRLGDSPPPLALSHQGDKLFYIRNLPCEIKLLSYDDYDLTRRCSLSNTLAAEQIIPIIKRPLRSITPNEFPLHQILHFRRFSSNS